MPFVGRTFAPRELVGCLKNRSWLHPQVRLSRITLREFVWNPLPGHLPPQPADDRVYVHFVVRGRAHLLRTGEVLEAGDAVLARSFRATLESEALAIVGDHDALALRLDERLLAPPPGAHTTLALPVQTIRDLHDRFGAARADHEAAQVCDDLVATLRAAGVSCELPERGRMSTAREGDAALAAGLTRAMTVESMRPGFDDLRAEGLTMTDRHLRRRVGDFFRRFGMPFGRWLEMRQSFCLTTAALAMSAPRARTDTVARASGFASPTSLCHALQRTGLASPQALAAGARELRRNL